MSCFTEPSSLTIVNIMQKVVSNAIEGDMLRHAFAYCGSIRAVSPKLLPLVSEQCPVHAVFCGQTQLNVAFAKDNLNAAIHTVEGRSGAGTAVRTAGAVGQRVPHAVSSSRAPCGGEGGALPQEAGRAGQLVWCCEPIEPTGERPFDSRGRGETLSLAL